MWVPTLYTLWAGSHALTSEVLSKAVDQCYLDANVVSPEPQWHMGKSKRNIQKEEQRNKHHHWMPVFTEGGTVFVYMPATRAGKTYKRLRPCFFLHNLIWYELTFPTFWLDSVVLRANEAKSWGTSISSSVEACWCALLLIAHIGHAHWLLIYDVAHVSSTCYVLYMAIHQSGMS